MNEPLAVQPAPAPLNPLLLPLQGSRLIEASAGTGKTWTIAALYLRLVLGQGGVHAGPVRPLWPGEILVMSFTKAATRELSDRIRERLVEAAACFRGRIEVPADDPFLAALLQAHESGALRDQAAWRLAMAAEAMDDAAVFTIDAWCQRMLREHAFDSGCLFDEELQADEAALRDEAVRDYWRQQVYPLHEAALAVLLATWPDVQALAKDVKRLLNQPLAEAAQGSSLAACIVDAAAARTAALAALKRGWVERTEAMRLWLHAQLTPKLCAFNRRKLQSARVDGWLDAILVWAHDTQMQFLPLPKDSAAFMRLLPGGMHDALNEGASVELPDHFAAFEALLAALPGVPAPAAALRAHAAAQVALRMQQLKQQAGRFGFADMLQRLNDALDEETLGERARRLRARILAQHPVALVDEFQDTSPVQLSIFQRLYRIDETPAELALLMIGDPKQAIYAFRGADIHSYLQARRATAGRHHVLGTNHRSSVALVSAVNGCFQRAEQRPGAGAFLFRPDGGEQGGGGGGDGGELPFLPVAARGREERFVTGTGTGSVAALALCLDAELRSADASRARHAAVCAERIVTLLNDPEAGFARPGQALQRLRPADIAVLVRTGTEAADVRAALRQRGVATVYLSDKDSVFASDEAADLLRLLQAVAAPRQMRLARAALATSLLALDLGELLQLATDDAAFDARCATLAELQRVWQGQGVLPMLRRALHAFGLPARWLAGDGAEGGERRLTNVLHLAELLQTASATLEGEAALLRWLAQALDDAEAGRGDGASEEQVLRLESDADLVKVVTVHKSKGLEYPLVFLPFATHCRPVKGRKGEPVWVADAQGRRVLQLQPSAAEVAAADAERLREDLRLLYVAMTRARHRLWVGVAVLKHGPNPACVWHRSAWGSLVSGPAPRTPEEAAADMVQLASELQGVDLEVLEADSDSDSDSGTDANAGAGPRTRMLPREAATPLHPAPTYAAVFDRLWTVSSYSALVRDAAATSTSGDAAPAADTPLRPLRDDEPAEADAAAAATRRAGDEAWHRFPRGAFAGNFLHDQLEWLADEHFALDALPALQQALQRRCERQGWGHRAEDVGVWLRRVCSTALPPLGVALAGLDRALPEMEFWLPSDGLDARAVDTLCRQHLLPGRARPALVERQLRGLLMGFADLVYAQDGHYGVLDYKSNALGTRDADYTTAAMETAMLEHRYDVQAALYLLALHRLLRARLGAAYRPAQQLHGAVYLFLRGVGTPSAGAYHLPAPLALISALDAMLPQASAAVALP